MKKPGFDLHPLAEKYASWSPYNYCTNNPIKYIDPDGNAYVDSNGVRITYSEEEGWSDNAANDIQMIYTALMLTDTGKAQWEKGYNSKSKIEMNLVENEKLKNNEGIECLGDCNQSLSSDGWDAKKTDKTMQIRIGVKNIRESLDNGQNKGLTLLEAIGATAGHEIEHTTEKNRDTRSRRFVIGANPLTNNNIQAKKPTKALNLRCFCWLMRVYKVL